MRKVWVFPLAVVLSAWGMFVQSESITNRMIQTASNLRPSQTDDRGRTKKQVLSRAALVS